MQKNRKGSDEMDIIICVNHGKMNGTNIVVNATIFNDSLNEFRFRVNDGEWVYVDRVDGMNKTQDVMFLGVNSVRSNKIMCQAIVDGCWEYMSHIIVSSHTSVGVANDMEHDVLYTYSEPKKAFYSFECEVF